MGHLRARSFLQLPLAVGRFLTSAVVAWQTFMVTAAVPSREPDLLSGCTREGVLDRRALLSCLSDGGGTQHHTRVCSGTGVGAPGQTTAPHHCVTQVSSLPSLSLSFLICKMRPGDTPC